MPGLPIGRAHSGLTICSQRKLHGKVYDAAIVGAGPAGLACAIGLALQGKKVVVIDSGQQPQDKACGEGLMADGLALLVALGIDCDKLGGRPLHGVTYIDGPHRLVLDWAQSLALGLRRTHLSIALWQRAKELEITSVAGRVTRVDDGKDVATIWLGSQSLDAELVVGADGLHSVVRRALGKNIKPRTNTHHPVRMGLRQHYYMAPWANNVEVYLADGMEAYVTPVSDDVVGVAILGPAIKGDFLAALAPFEELVRRLEHAPCASARRGAGPLDQQVPSITGQRVALVGDASGYRDALTGEGLTLALGEAALLCRCVDKKLGLAHYAAKHKKLTSRYRFSVFMLLWLGRHPRIRSLMIKVVGLFPKLGSWMARWATRLPA